jgi:hypothetical protein
MKTTNNKHIINDKLQGVDLPDMDASWQKMEQTIEASGAVQSGWSAFVVKYKIYLNLFIAATTIGVVGLLVKSNTLSTRMELEAVPSYTGNTPYQLNYLSFTAEIDHEDDLPIPFGPMQKEITYTGFNPSIDQTTKPIGEPTGSDSALSEVVSSMDESTEDTSSVPEAEVAIENTIIDAIEIYQYPHKPLVYIHNQVGIKIQSGILPDISVRNAIQNTGFGVYARRFVSPKSAIHVEVGYNPIAIRPISYVEKYSVFNNVNYTQTDSAVVNRLKYVTIPINWYYQLNKSLSVTAGPQISFLTGISGDLTRKLSYPTGPESNSDVPNISIANRGGFKTKDIGINVAISFHTGRFELGAQVQQSFGDYTSETLSKQTHRFKTLQLKAACLLSK